MTTNAQKFNSLKQATYNTIRNELIGDDNLENEQSVGGGHVVEDEHTVEDEHIVEDEHTVEDEHIVEDEHTVEDDDAGDISDNGFNI